MKTLGLLGGMSWESTVTYYKEINERVAKSLGGLHSAKILLYSVDFAEIEEQQAEGDWAGSAELLGRAAKGLVAAGADACPRARWGRHGSHLHEHHAQGRRRS